MISETQMLKNIRVIIDEELEFYKQRRSITVVNNIPDTTAIPIEKPNCWLKIPDVICVFVDMINSTLLSANKHDNSTAGIYRLFTSTAIRIFNEFESPYIDVKGDGIFALFNSNQAHRSLAAAVTFKTFVEEEFTPKIKEEIDFDIGAHIGIDQKTVLVRKLGLKRYTGRTDRQNEVWAGKPVNMAAKLSSLSGSGELLVSDRYFNNFSSELVLKSCGCGSDGEKVDLWKEIDLSEEDRFDFDKAYLLKSKWCRIHGKEYCEKIIKLDE